MFDFWIVCATRAPRGIVWHACTGWFLRIDAILWIFIHINIQMPKTCMLAAIYWWLVRCTLTVCCTEHTMQRQPALLQEPMTCNTVLAVMFLSTALIFCAIKFRPQNASFFRVLFAQCAHAIAVGCVSVCVVFLSMQQRWRRRADNTRNIHENPVQFHFARLVVCCTVTTTTTQKKMLCLCYSESD